MLRRVGVLLGLWMLCALALAAVPERPRFRVIGVPQGLPSSEINALARDRDGYLWIGSVDGLARYDGVEMRVWRHDPADPAGLPGNNVQALLVDATDRVWVAVEGGGISILDRQRRAFTNIRMATHPDLGSDDIWAFKRQGDAVWFGTYGGGLHRMTPDGRIRRYTAANDGLPSDTFLALEVDAADTLWVGTDAGLARMQGDRFETVTLPGAEGTPMVYLVALQAGALWIGTSEGVWQRRDGRWSQPEWSPMFHRPNALKSMASDRNGDQWLGSQRGLWRLRAGGVPQPVPTGGPDFARGINTMLLQDDGALWTPVAGLGLGYLRSNWRQLAHYAGPGDGLRGSLYRTIAPAAGGGFWLGGLNGVVERLGANGTLAPLDDDSLARLRGIKLLSVVSDRDGRLWLGHRHGLLRVGTDGSIDEWGPKDAQDPIPPGQVDHLHVAADGSLWLTAPGGGVQRRNPATGKVLLDLRVEGDTGLGSGDIEVSTLSPEGELWLGGHGGVSRLDVASRRFVPVAEMQADRVFAMAFDGPGRVWLQRQSGLAQYLRRGGRWEQAATVGVEQGMPALGASGLRVDARHRVWVTTTRGLWRWDPRSKRLRQHGVQDGATSQEYLDRALAMDAAGVLAAATIDGGLLLVDTAVADPPTPTPVLRFDRFSVRRAGTWHDLPTGATLQLNRDDREVRMGARLLAFDDPGASRYWALLEGFDRNWVALGNTGERVFTGLAPGRYTLRMRAQDAAGNATREQALVFVVPPPWWRTWWAWLAYAAIVLAMLATAGMLYRARLKRRHVLQLAEHKRELAEQASEAKSRFLATLGHEVRTPMTGVLGMSELLQGSPLDARQRTHVDAIRRAGEHLLRLVNDALDLARIEAGKLELANADFALRSLLDDVAGLMAPVAERKGLAFVEHVDDEVPQALHGDRTRVQQILLNLIGNAVKFTESGHVALEAGALQPQGVRITVADTGPGLSAEQQARVFRRFEQAEGARTASRYGGSGLGLAISQELAAAMGGTITVESEAGRGTRFIVDLPLPAAHVSSLSPASGVAHAAGDSLQLLLVEDDAIVAETLVGLLQAQGHAVAHAAHGLAALTEVATHRFDAALLDLDLPGMDGLALARMLRSQGSGLPLLAVTARSDAEAETQARAAGFDGFLRKPVTGAMLAHALGQIVPR